MKTSEQLIDPSFIPPMPPPLWARIYTDEETAAIGASIAINVARFARPE